MKTHWMVETRGDPLGAVRGFLKTLWMSAELDGMIVSSIGKRPGQQLPDILISPGELDQFNPFRPLMEVNAAKYLPDLLRQHSEGHFGVVLRPCEMRALIEMVKRDALALERLLTICIDCLGTYPAEEYEWRASRKGSSQVLTRDGLRFAHMGGIAAYRYRSACQMCISPRASGAHLNLGVLGLPVRQHLLIQARDSITAEWLQLDLLADREADPDLVEVRERTVSKMAERNSRTRERITQGLADVLPRDVGSLIEQFEACGACQECLNNCPICAVDSPRRGPDRKYLREDITRWMISCAGCGMCEQACPHHLPLTAIFHYIKQQLAQSYGYTPGLSASEPLPLM